MFVFHSIYMCSVSKEILSLNINLPLRIILSKVVAGKFMWFIMHFFRGSDRLHYAKACVNSWIEIEIAFR
jgi:hypothetical protein